MTPEAPMPTPVGMLVARDGDNHNKQSRAGGPVLHGETFHFWESIRPSCDFGKRNLKLWCSEMTSRYDVGFRADFLEMSG